MSLSEVIRYDLRSLDGAFVEKRFGINVTFDKVEWIPFIDGVAGALFRNFRSSFRYPWEKFMAHFIKYMHVTYLG